MGSSFNNTLLKGGAAGKRMDIRATDSKGREVIITLTDNSGKAGTANYYTLDGSDPRAPQGGTNAAAIRYTGPRLRLDRQLHPVR